MFRACHVNDGGYGVSCHVNDRDGYEIEAVFSFPRLRSKGVEDMILVTLLPSIGKCMYGQGITGSRHVNDSRCIDTRHVIDTHGRTQHPPGV